MKEHLFVLQPDTQTMIYFATLLIGGKTPSKACIICVFGSFKPNNAWRN